jgi:hypothetical protein
MRIGAAAAAVLALTACGSSTALPAAPASTFDPIAFFTGRAHGEGQLDTLFASPVPIIVESSGRLQGGTLILDQAIRQGDRPARVRRWTMRRAGPNRYDGSLTDAVGPVQVTTEGPRALIRYTMKNGFHVEQELALQRDGKTVLNRLKVRKLGIRVATVDETIRKLD